MMCEKKLTSFGLNPEFKITCDTELEAYRILLNEVQIALNSGTKDDYSSCECPYCKRSNILVEVD